MIRLQNLGLRQTIVGLLALPLSVLPIMAYLSFTPEGRIVRDRALVAVNPPTLPEVSRADIAAGRVPAYGGAVIPLVYHGVGSTSSGEGRTVVSAEQFGEHLVALKRAGMRAVTAEQVAEAFRGGKPLPKRAVMISFDDGRADAVMYADPLLEQAEMRATMFVITSAADQPGVYYAPWDKLTSPRWSLESHTDSLHDEHDAQGGESLPALTSLAEDESLAGYRARIRDDLDTADEALADHGRLPVAFAYPFGAYGADRTNSPAVRSALRDILADRYQLAFHQDDQSTVPLATPFDDRFGLRRLEVGDWSGRELLRRITAAAARTPQALDRRTDDLTEQVDAGEPPPLGIEIGPPASVADADLAAPVGVAGPAPTPTPETPRRSASPTPTATTPPATNPSPTTATTRGPVPISTTSTRPEGPTTSTTRRPGATTTTTSARPNTTTTRTSPTSTPVTNPSGKAPPGKNK